MEYGAEFDVLKEKQRGEIFQRAVRDGLFGRVKVDEREAEQRAAGAGGRVPVAGTRAGCVCRGVLGRVPIRAALEATRGVHWR